MWLVKIPRSPFWQVRYPDPDGSGRIVQSSTRETSERAAKLRAAEIIEAHRKEHERTRSGGDVTVETVAEQYWDTELSKRKWAPSAGAWLAAIVHHLGRTTRYCDVTIADVARFLDAHSSRVSDSSLNRALAVWRRMHNHASKIRAYPVQMIDWAQVRRDEPEGRTRHLSPDELVAVLRNLPDHAQAIVIFAVLTGARKAQVLGLTWDRVDLEHHTVTIFRKSRKRYAPHTLDLHPAAERILRREREARPEAAEVFDTTNFRKLFAKACSDAGVNDFRFHDLRHTFATMMARKTGLAVLQRLLGHGAITTTMRYAHVQREDMRAGILTLPSFELQPQAKCSRETPRDTEGE